MVWALFAPTEKRRAVVMLGLVILMALAETLGVLSIMPFLSVLARPEIVNEQPALQMFYRFSGAADMREFILALGLATMAVVVLSSAFKIVTLHLLNRFVHFQRHSISARLLSRYLHQPYEFFLTRNPSLLGKNVLSEVDQLVLELIQPLAMLIAQGMVVLAMALVVLFYDPWMALCIGAVVGALYGTIYFLVRKRLARIGAQRAAANSGRYQACNEALGGIKDVKVTHAAPVYMDAFARHSRAYSRHKATAETLTQSPLYIVEATGYSGLIAIALVLLWQSGDIGLVLPALGLYGFAAYRVLPAVQIMYRGLARLRFSSAILGDLHRDLELPQQHLRHGDSSFDPQREIRLQGIHYAYPASPERPVFEGLDLAIPARTSVGITGKSGAGKSTLMDLFLGLLHPQAGALYVDGTMIDATNVLDWQNSIGYVPQHIYLCDASVAENIALGTPVNDINMEAVEEAARAAQIHEFIDNELPHGYRTRVGERGVRLSGGQRQRIGIARALYGDPSVLFFDEATSALDQETEERLNDAIKALAKEKTVILVAHREATLRMCQQVITLGNGSLTSSTRMPALSSQRSE